MTVDVPELATGIPPRTELLRVVFFGERNLQIESHDAPGRSWGVSIIGMMTTVPDRSLRRQPANTRPMPPPLLLVDQHRTAIRAEGDAFDKVRAGHVRISRLFPPASSMTLTVVAGLAAQCVPRGSAEHLPFAQAPLDLVLPSSPPCRGRTPAPTKPAASFMPRSLLLALLCALCVNACAVVTVAGAAVSVAATAVSVTATVVETTVDVAAAGVGAVVGDDEDEDDED